jgi:hypothetical protein
LRIDGSGRPEGGMKGFLEGAGANELETAIDARRLADRVESLALTVFSAEELAAQPPDLRNVLHMLFKRRMRVAGNDLSLEDCLRIRQQFDQYCDNRTGNGTAFRLASQLR